MTDDRTYMVMGEDREGDYELFASDDRARAEQRYFQMLTTHVDVRANWLNDAPTAGHA